MTDLQKVCERPMCASRKRNLPFACWLARPLTLLVCSAAIACGQQAAPETPPAPSTSLASQFFEHDFVNIYAFGNGVYDTALPQVTAGGSGYGASYGYDVGGGLTVGHSLKDGTFSLAYRGDYRHYQADTYSNGTNQGLSLLFSKRLSRQWSIFTTLGGGIVQYGGELYNDSSSIGTNVLTNPLSSQSRFANAAATLTFEQTRRLSYSLSGQYFYNNYNYSGAVSSFGGTGTASVNYRTTAHATVGGSYSHSYFEYSGQTGTSNIDSGFLTLQYGFSRRWSATASVGVSRAHTQGIVSIPVTLLLDQQLVSGYIVGPYNRTTTSPSYQGSLIRSLHHSSLSLSGGQGINAGNGTIYTAKNLFGGGVFSLTHHLTNLSFAGSYSRLTSIANTVSERYSSSNASISYGFNIVRYISANLRYDFIHYDGLYALKGVNESRFTLGFSFSSKSIPLTLF